jgi:hypothetical protein
MSKQKTSPETEPKQSLAERAGLKRAWVAGDPEPHDLEAQSLETLQTMLDHAIETVGPDSEAAQRLLHAIDAKTSENDEGRMSNGSQEKPPAFRTIVLQIPLAEPPAHAPYLRNSGLLHVEFQLDERLSETLRHLAAGLKASGAESKGKRIESPQPAMRWVLEQIAEQIQD